MTGTWQWEGIPNVGDPCIIYVDTVNRPTGWWLGRVSSVGAADRLHPAVTAIIQAPFEGDALYAADIDHEPSVNYSVYPRLPDLGNIIKFLRGETIKSAPGKCRTGVIRDGRFEKAERRSGNESTDRTLSDPPEYECEQGRLSGGFGGSNLDLSARRPWLQGLDSAIREATDVHRARIEKHQRERRDDGIEQRAALGDHGCAPWTGAQAFDPLVREFHGIPEWLDRDARAAGWTPARVYAAKIRALGNAVVPSVAHAVGLVLRQWMENMVEAYKT